MNWLHQDAQISDEDTRTLFFRDVQPSRIIRISKSTEKSPEIKIWDLSTEKDWTEWLLRASSTTPLGNGSSITLLLCGRVRKRFIDPLIVANLPFSRSIFHGAKAAFRIHGSIARVINRNTSCIFMAMPTMSMENEDERCIVYNCRTASTWPGDMALSMSFFPQTFDTYAVMYGCDEDSIQMFTKRLTQCDHDVLHPMVVPTLLAERERQRHVLTLRGNVTKTVQRIYDLTVNRRHLAQQSDLSDSISNTAQEDSVTSWLDMNYLKNGLQNWQVQMEKMTAHLDDFASISQARCNDAEDVEAGIQGRGAIAIHLDMGEWKVSGTRIKQRLQELIDEYDEQIRECSTVIEGLNLVTSTEIRHSNEDIAYSSLTVSKLAQRDGNLMKSIALLTMIYLPATFSSTFFSMDFFDWPKTEQAVITRYIWIYGVVAVGLTALTVGIFLTFNFRKRRSTETLGACNV